MKKRYLIRGGVTAMFLLLCFSTVAQAQRRNTDWFVKAGYGVFVHYLDGIQNNADQLHSLGKQTSWDECVRDFDTERFAADVEASGAGYAIVTVMQISRFMIAPNATFDRITGYKPGEACATRDLIEDLYQSLSRRNIKLMLYWTGDGPRADDKAGPAYGCGNPVSKEFVQKWADTFREYGERYGDKIAGIWCDGCYSFIGYDDEKLGILAAGLHAGSDTRIIALNPGVDPEVRRTSSMKYPSNAISAASSGTFFPSSARPGGPTRASATRKPSSPNTCGR